MKPYTALLFDADGTLLDFEKAEEYSFFYTGREFGLDLTPEMKKTYHAINMRPVGTAGRGENSKSPNWWSSASRTCLPNMG